MKFTWGSRDATQEINLTVNETYYNNEDGIEGIWEARGAEHIILGLLFVFIGKKGNGSVYYSIDKNQAMYYKDSSVSTTFQNRRKRKKKHRQRNVFYIGV